MFNPPHCPNPDCRHFRKPQDARWHRKISPYRTKTFGLVPRYICRHCNKSFSAQTFSIDYYAKKHIDFRYVHQQINAGAGIRSIARSLNVSPKTVTSRIRRLARNAILIHQRFLKHLAYAEDFAADGFESFCVSQYFPDNTNILVGSQSQFVYQWDHAAIRRKGRMRKDQKERRALLEKTFKAHPKAIENSFGTLMKFLAQRSGKKVMPLILFTDEKRDYERCLWKTPLTREQMFSGKWHHHRVNSKEPRTRQNPLFPVNYMDREIRKDMAAHARESVQFNRNVSEGMLRMSLYFFDHNYFKPYRVAKAVEKKLRHAEAAGLKRPLLDRITQDFWTKRYFWRGREKIDESALKTLNRLWETPMKRRPEMVCRHLAV